MPVGGPSLRTTRVDGGRSKGRCFDSRRVLGAVRGALENRRRTLRVMRRVFHHPAHGFPTVGVGSAGAFGAARRPGACGGASGRGGGAGGPVYFGSEWNGGEWVGGSLGARWGSTRRTGVGGGSVWSAEPSWCREWVLRSWEGSCTPLHAVRFGTRAPRPTGKPRGPEQHACPVRGLAKHHGGAWGVHARRSSMRTPPRSQRARAGGRCEEPFEPKASRFSRSSLHAAPSTARLESPAPPHRRRPPLTNSPTHQLTKTLVTHTPPATHTDPQPPPPPTEPSCVRCGSCA